AAGPMPAPAPMPGGAVAPMPAPGSTTEMASAAAEREANELLGKGETEAATTRFAEAERLRAQEQAQAGAMPAANDPSVQRVDGAVAAAPPVGPLPAPDASPGTNRGEQLLAEARALYAGGNYAGARQMATEARTGQHGVDAQADE